MLRGSSQIARNAGPNSGSSMRPTGAARRRNAWRRRPRPRSSRSGRARRRTTARAGWRASCSRRQDRDRGWRPGFLRDAQQFVNGERPLVPKAQRDCLAGAEAFVAAGSRSRGSRRRCRSRASSAGRRRPSRARLCSGTAAGRPVAACATGAANEQAGQQQGGAANVREARHGGTFVAQPVPDSGGTPRLPP